MAPVPLSLLPSSISSLFFCSHSAHRGRRPNGATQTFRRPSLATTNSHSAHQRDSSASILSPSTASGAYVPPHLSANRNGASLDARYSHDQLLDLFKQHKDLGDLDDSISDLYMGEMDVDPAPMGRWTRRDDSAVDPSSRPDVCLNNAADSDPIGLIHMSADERDVRTTS